VAMPIFIGAFAEYFFIFFTAPSWIEKLVGSVEVLFSGEIKNCHK
jgi:hypothetical protein